MADTTVCFGDYELDFARRELRRSGAPVDVQLTPLRVLLYLAEHRERTVPRRELLDAIWPGVVVGDEALTTALGHARQAVGDGGDAQRVIRTLKGQGYRFVAEVRAGEPAPHEPAPPSRRGERALTAILSGDIAGYSRLIAEDEDGTIRTLRAWREQVGALVPEHHGQLVDFTGDNFLAEFPAARAAVECAVEIQRVLAARNAALPPERRLHFRIGLHLGDVRREEGRLYGDGVNIAARLQQLAEPGGLCLSGAVVEQVRGKLALEFDDLGEQTLKNIPHPVRTWRPRSPAAEGVPARPAIAVLPFDNFSADPAQAFFADGLAEDLITRLSSFRSFPVIARTSSFQYRGGGIDVKRVGQELGARYLVEGSVRRSGERIRVSAQLIDAASGEQLWSDTYDREVAEVFELQDDISATIAASMTGNLGRAEAARARQRDPGDLEAWGLYQLGLQDFHRTTREDIGRGSALFEQAIARDPRFAVAHAYLAYSIVMGDVLGGGRLPDAVLARALELTRHAIEVDPGDAVARAASSLVYQLQGDRERALEQARLAVDLNPSLTGAWQQLGYAQWGIGDLKACIASSERVRRLDPRGLGFNARYVDDNLELAYWELGRYEESLAAARRLAEFLPGYYWSSLMVAANAVELGRLDEARSAIRAARAAQPNLTLEMALRSLMARPEVVARLEPALRRAGLE